MVWLLSVLIDQFYGNGYRLPAGYRASAVSVRPGCEIWLRDLVARPDCMHADVTHLLLQVVDLPRVEQWHDKAGTRRVFSVLCLKQWCRAENGNVEMIILSRI